MPPEHPPSPAIAVSSRGLRSGITTQCRCGRRLLLCQVPLQPDYFYWRHLPERRRQDARSAPIFTEET